MSYIMAKIEKEETKGQDMRNSTPGQTKSDFDNTENRGPGCEKALQTFYIAHLFGCDLLSKTVVSLNFGFSFFASIFS